jgi:hypothetical protein
MCLFIQLRDEDEKARAPAVNAKLRVTALQIKNIGKGSDRFIPHFKENEPVAVTIWAESGVHGEFSWAVSVQQGTRRSLLAGCAMDQLRESATWEALATFATFEPMPGKPKSCPVVILDP